jgi:hypothetical protein
MIVTSGEYRKFEGFYVNNPRALQELNGDVQRETADISRQALSCVSRNEVCVEAGGRHFETFVRSKVSCTGGGRRTLKSRQMRRRCRNSQHALNNTLRVAYFTHFQGLPTIVGFPC